MPETAPTADPPSSSAEVRAAPLVSIMIPVYRGRSFVGAAIESALAQRHVPTEIIVVDDASPDDSVEVVKRLQASHPGIRLLRHDRNQGVSGAWNTGMEAARGEFVLRLAQDDILLPEAVEQLLATFRSRPEADVVYADAFGLLPGGTVVEAHRPVADEATLFRGDDRLGVCVMIHRRVIESGLRYDPRVKAAEDLDFFVRVFDHGFRFARHHGPGLIRFRVHDEAGSVTKYALQQIESARILAPREPDPLKRRAIWSYRYEMAVYQLRQERRWKDALRTGLEGLRTVPGSWPLWKQFMAALFRKRPIPS